LLHDYGFKNVTLLHNKTFLELKVNIDLIKKIREITGYHYIETTPKHTERIGDIIKKSFEQVEKIAEYIKLRKQNYRDFIDCCRKLKKAPSRRWYLKNIDIENTVIISSLCPFESWNRRRWLKELKEKDTFIRLHGKMGSVYYAYPFRDIYSNEPFRRYLIIKEIFPEHSGCIICPIRMAHMIVKNDFYDCPDLRFYEKISGKKFLVYIKEKPKDPCVL